MSMPKISSPKVSSPKVSTQKGDESPKTTLLIGKKKAGKSFLIQQILSSSGLESPPFVFPPIPPRYPPPPSPEHYIENYLLRKKVLEKQEQERKDKSLSPSDPDIFPSLRDLRSDEEDPCFWQEEK